MGEQKGTYNHQNRRRRRYTTRHHKTLAVPAFVAPSAAAMSVMQHNEIFNANGVRAASGVVTTKTIVASRPRAASACRVRACQVAALVGGYHEMVKVTRARQEGRC